MASKTGAGVDLHTIVARLQERPGVKAVTLATRDGAVLFSTLGDESDEAKLHALHFSKVITATQDAYAAIGQKDVPEVLSLVSAHTEFVLSLGPASQQSVGSFFVTCRDTTVAAADTSTY